MTAPIASASVEQDTAAVQAVPPVARRVPVTATHHGVVLVDDYAWLRAGNWQEVMRKPATLATDIRAHLEAENAYTDAMLVDTKALQETLFLEMKARLKEDDRQVPQPDGPFEYFPRFVKGGQYPQLCRIPRGGCADDAQVLLDGNAAAEGKSYWDLGGTAHSNDHTLLAYATDDKGSELYTIRIRDLATGKDFGDEIPDTRGSLQWANDSKTLFYIKVDEHQRPLFVYRHVIGTPVSDDVLVYQEEDSGFFVGLSATQSQKFILIDIHDHETSEVRLIDADDPLGQPQVVARRRVGHQYDVEHHGSHLVITTNSDGAEDFRIVTAPVNAPNEANWREIVPHKPGRLLIDVNILANHMARLEREESLPRIVVTPLKTDAEGDLLDRSGEHSIAFDEEAYALGLSAGYEYDTTRIRFTYSSLTTPAETYDYDMTTRERALRKRQEVPSGHNPADYVTRRLFAPASDGELVPVTLLYKKTTPLNGSAPLFLYGYGAYGISMPASFSTARLSLVDRGFIFAIAHVRGGKDKGFRWYTDGKMKKKKNTFTDFIAAGEHLIAQGFTRRGRIVANGGSAGGMLMGAVANMAPDLFLGIIADVPFVDVLNTMLDKDLPLTPPEWPEWGNPLTNKDDFDNIRSYSPYDNVEAKRYPHILALAGLTDPRVTYWEPAKWIAKLRTLNTSDNLVLLKTNMGAGHGGASGRFDGLKDTAFNFAFALKVAGLV
ncbi:oligopeptidase B [Hyphomicrobium denitrificans 1NES1]|uniref:Oligopeptidase B n=1 Tax=Hyphomicrobium denitrificans 1NES1 TaxID=670307 RepID=N0BC78_9HYPH|nr:S9 family peptidase [Hyphomicrobium denitrificans]AGK58116.1 oligopeptidase B [Hyphomicrobium denitrificans 1NES1]